MNTALFINVTSQHPRQEQPSLKARSNNIDENRHLRSYQVVCFIGTRVQQRTKDYATTTQQ